MKRFFQSSAPRGRSGNIAQFILIIGILLAVNVMSSFIYTRFDLTQEKRFQLTKSTKQLLSKLDDRITVNILLDGELNAPFQRLKDAVRQTLDDFRSESGYIDYAFEDPNTGTTEDINARRKKLQEQGILPITVRERLDGEIRQKIIYPIAIVHYGDRQIPVKLVENESPGFSNEEVIANSIALLEYKFAHAIQKIRALDKPTILFTKGHGELANLQTADLRKTLAPFFQVGQILLDSIVQLKPEDCQLLIIAKPRGGFSEKEKFKIDQFIMNGGNTMWLIDRLNAEMDSLAFTGKHIPMDYPLNIEDMLFKYGIRIMPDLVLDFSCTRIPLKVGQLGNAPQLDLFKWPYFPAVTPSTNHVLARNLSQIEFKFCSSIDTIETRKSYIKKSILLQSSKYSRLQFSPMELNFEMLRNELKKEKFDKGNQNLAVLLEGNFSSNYENRITEEMRNGLAQIGITPREQGEAAKMIVISDGDIAANFVRDTANWLPLGYNRFENETFANKDFILNCIEYLTDPNGVIESRAKEVKVRLLDEGKIKDEKVFWQVLNTALPIVLVLLFVFGYWRWRKRKYTG